MKSTRRAALLGLTGAMFLGNRGCTGTNTGNAECAAPDACVMPVSIVAPDGTEWRGGAFLDELSGSQIQFDGQQVTHEGGACKSGGGTIRGHIPLASAESVRTADGGLKVEFQDPRLDVSWPNSRPQFTEDDSQFAVYRMALEVSPDGILTASLDAVTITIQFDAGIPVDTTETEVGTFRFEGPLGVSCDEGKERREIPVASGETASIRCAQTIPETSCDDTVENGWSCSTSSKWMR